MSHTPRQIQIINKKIKIRLHNELAFQVNIHGGKADFEGGEADDTMEWVKKQQEDNEQKEKEIDVSIKHELRELGNG